MNYIFGEKIENLTSKQLPSVLDKARQLSVYFPSVSLEKILNILDKVKSLWFPGSRFYLEALRALSKENSFSIETIKMSLDLIPELLDSKTLRARLSADFNTEDQSFPFLDGFSRRPPFEGRERFVPHGVLLHVTAGNIFLGFLDSLLMGLITKNVNIVKISSENKVFPQLFVDSVLEADSERYISDKFALLQYRGGDVSFEGPLKSGVDAIICWGGAEMVASYKQGLPPHIPLIEHGPKFSFQILSKDGLSKNHIETVAKNIAEDLALWDQVACASPQNLFIQEGVPIEELMAALGKALDGFPLKRGPLHSDEEVEILKEKYRSKVTQIEGQGYALESDQYMLHFDPRPGARLSPLQRTLIIKKYTTMEDLRLQLKPVKRILQTVGYLLSTTEKEIYLNSLAEFGVLRFAPLGSMLHGLIGAPHDGRLSLLELGRVVPDESFPDKLQFINDVIVQSPFYRSLYEGKEVKSLSDLKPIEKLNLPLPKQISDGYIFGTGGTSAAPRFIYFSNEEFNETAKLMGRSYLSQGLHRGDVCANLFVAGNLWSSFLIVDKALNFCGVTQLPLGGLASQEFAHDILKRYQPRAVFGLPSLLVEVAFKSKQKGENLSIPMVFYAGEHMTLQNKEFLKNVWGVEKFYSAGYASVDAGLIGYQCQFSKPKEHHLFEDKVHLEIINGEGYVTSLIRKHMPAIHLKTGDHLEWSRDPEPCRCGSQDRRFILHGRMDSQIRIWSSIIDLQHVEMAFKELGVEVLSFVVELNDPDQFIVHFETTCSFQEEDFRLFKDAFYKNSSDLAKAFPRSYIDGRVFMRPVLPGQIPHVVRTGKIKSIVDNRKY